MASMSELIDKKIIGIGSKVIFKHTFGGHSSHKDKIFIITGIQNDGSYISELKIHCKYLLYVKHIDNSYRNTYYCERFVPYISNSFEEYMKNNNNFKILNNLK